MRRRLGPRRALRAPWREAQGGSRGATRLTLLVAGAVIAALAGTAWAEPKESLAKAKAEFERGEYKRVVALLSPEVPRLREQSDLIQAHYLLGVAYFYGKNRELARLEFSALLYLEPNYQLDPATESPEVYAFYDALQRELREKLEEIRKQKLREEEARRQPLREVVIEKTIHETSPWGNFVPFGYGQFRNGQTAKGVFFLIAESLSGGASVALFSQQAVTYGIPSHYPPDLTDDDRQAIRTRQAVQVVTGGVFLVTYIWGVIDAFTNQKPHVTETRSERPYTPPPARTSRLLLTTPELGPLGAPDSVGLSATWRF